MATYYNQKDITCMKSDKVEPPYMTFSEREFIDVCHTFKGNASVVLVWQYLMKNKNGYCLEFSSKACSNFTALSENTIRKAIKELEDKCYLINVVENQYLCFTAPLGNVEEVVEYYYPQLVQKCTLYQDLVVPPSNSGTPSTKIWETPPSNSGTQTSSTSKQSKSIYVDESREEKREIDKNNVSTGKSSKSKTKGRMLEDLSLEELQGALDDFNNQVDYEKIKKRYGLAKNSLPNAKDLFMNKVPKMIELLKRDVFSDARSQLATLQNLPLEDIRDVLSSSGIDLSKDYDIGYMFQGEEPEVRQQLKDRFNLSILFTDCEGEFCLRLMEYAKSGDKDKFIENTKYWDTVKARR